MEHVLLQRPVLETCVVVAAVVAVVGCDSCCCCCCCCSSGAVVLLRVPCTALAARAGLQADRLLPPPTPPSLGVPPMSFSSSSSSSSKQMKGCWPKKASACFPTISVHFLLVQLNRKHNTMKRCMKQKIGTLCNVNCCLSFFLFFVLFLSRVLSTSPR